MKQGLHANLSQTESGSCFSKLIMLFLVLTCSFVSRTDSYSVAGKVSFDTNGNDPAVKGLVCYHICI